MLVKTKIINNFVKYDNLIFIMIFNIYNGSKIILNAK